jgi:copper oxidase (laccase) domain-containing protein
MVQPLVAISTVRDGNMYIPGDTENTDVIENRRRWLESNNFSMANATRLSITYDGTDFCRYRTLTEADKGNGMYNNGSAPADALVVTTPGHALFLPVADCVATVLFDAEHSVLMLAHLGRHSLEQQGGVAAVEYLKQHFHTNPATVTVWLSPAPSPEFYPIFALGNKGMKQALYEQLAAAGIQADAIHDTAIDTDTDQNYYSHSAYLQGMKQSDGRFAMVAMMVEDSENTAS